MLPRLLAAAALVLASQFAAAQTNDPNLQNLLTSAAGGTITTINGVYQLPGVFPR